MLTEICTIDAKKLSEDRRKMVVDQASMIFPINERITLTKEQINWLINLCPTKVHYAWDIFNDLDNSIFQVTKQSIKNPDFWKIFLWNLKSYKQYFNSLNQAILELSEAQLKYYDNLIVEVDSNTCFDKKVGESFDLVTDLDEIKKILSFFIPDAYKFDDLLLNSDSSYSRQLWLGWEKILSKKIYTKKSV